MKKIAIVLTLLIINNCFPMKRLTYLTKSKPKELSTLTLRHYSPNSLQNEVNNLNVKTNEEFKENVKKIEKLKEKFEPFIISPCYIGFHLLPYGGAICSVLGNIDGLLKVTLVSVSCAGIALTASTIKHISATTYKDILDKRTHKKYKQTLQKIITQNHKNSSEQL